MNMSTNPVIPSQDNLIDAETVAHLLKITLNHTKHVATGMTGNHHFPNPNPYLTRSWHWNKGHKTLSY